MPGREILRFVTRVTPVDGLVIAAAVVVVKGAVSVVSSAVSIAVSVATIVKSSSSSQYNESTRRDSGTHPQLSFSVHSQRQ